MLRPQGWRRVGQRTAALVAATAALLAIAATLAGTSYLKGILFTTIARKTGTGVLNLNPSSPSSDLQIFAGICSALYWLLAVPGASLFRS